MLCSTHLLHLNAQLPVAFPFLEALAMSYTADFGVLKAKDKTQAFRVDSEEIIIYLLSKVDKAFL